MQLKKNLLTIMLFSTFTIAGCSNEPKTTESKVESNQKTEENIETDLNNSSKEVQSHTVEDIKSVPLDQYQDINEINQAKDLSWMTPLFLAQTTRQMSNEDKLNLLYPEYYNEQDAFKKKDLYNQLLPKMEAELKKYSGDYRLKIPVIDDRTNQRDTIIKERLSWVYFNYAFSCCGSYNFETKSFPISNSSLKFGNSSQMIENEQMIKLSTPIGKNSNYNGITYNLPYEPVVPESQLHFKVDDEILARKIESLNSSNYGAIDETGYIYFKVVADENVIWIIPIYADISYYIKETGEDLFSKKYNWK